jgi:hypothetical protein
VRAVMGEGEGITTAEAMWAIYELAEAGGFEMDLWANVPSWAPLFTEANVPAGIVMAKGVLHIDGGAPSWSDLSIDPVHEKLAEIRRLIASLPREAGEAGDSLEQDTRPLPTKVWTVEDYYRLKDFYDKRGLIFNPALVQGSPAVAHLMSQAQLRATFSKSEDAPNADVRAARTPLFPKGVPDKPDIVDLVTRLDSERPTGKSRNQVAREFTGEQPGKDARAQSLLRQIRRMENDGRVKLQ